MSSLATSHASFLLEKRFRDSLTNFWIEAARETSPYEVALARALQSLAPDANIVVVFSYLGDEKESVEMRGARSSFDEVSGDFTAAELGAEELRRLQRVLEQPPLEVVETYKPLVIRVLGAEGERVGVSLSFSAEEGLREDFAVLFEGPLKEDIKDAVEWFSRFTPGHREMHSALQALKRSGHLSRFRHKADSLRFQRTELLSTRLRSGQALIARIRFHATRQPFPEYAAILDELGLWVIQEVLGTEWHTRSGDAEVHSSLVAEFFRDLVGVLDEIHQLHLQGTAESLGESDLEAEEVLSTHLEVFRAMAGADRHEEKIRAIEAVTGDSFDSGRPLWLILLWSRWHETAAELMEVGDLIEREGLDQAWNEAIAGTLTAVNRLLRAGWAGEEAKIKGFSSWLNLWLARELMLQVCCSDGLWKKRRVLERERWRFRSHLAFVLREGIRQAELGERPDFQFDPRTYIESVSQLVEQHAHFVAGVPRKYGIGALLEEIGRGRHADDYPFATSHRQHAIQVYIFGHFMLNLRVKVESGPLAGEEGLTVKKVLARSPAGASADADADDLVKAFSLASVHHDVGMLLFPRIFFPLAKLIHRGGEMPEILKRVDGSIAESSEEFSDRCKDDLSSSSFIKEEESHLLSAIDLDKRPEADSAQLKAVGPDHSLLGAWYLQQASTSIGLDEGSQRRIVGPAVRAVLLHQIPSWPIKVEDDPVAALLVVCDEVFDWLPTEKRKPHLHSGSTGAGLGQLDVRPEGSRADSILLPDVSALDPTDGEDPGGLCWQVEVDDDSLKRGWPRIEVELKEPDHLDEPVWLIWLQAFENLARIEQSETGWGPEFAFSSSVPGRLRANDQNTNRLLELTSERLDIDLRTKLTNWLASDRFWLDTDSTPPREGLTIRGEMTLPFGEGVKGRVAAIRETIEAVLKK